MQKYKKILSNFSSQNKGFLPPKIQKNTALSTMAIQLIFSKSQKWNTFTVSLKYSNVNIAQNKSTIYRRDTYNLQTRTVIFPHQEKLLEKVDGGQNTKNPQIKHYPCPKQVMIFRPGLYNLQTRIKQKKFLRIETDPS